MAKKDKCSSSCSRLGSVGGQALIEGVMMKSKNRIALAVRRYDDNKITVRAKKYVSLKQKHKWINIPILRGVINFVETLVMSFKTLTDATEMLGLEEEEPGKFEKWLTKVLGKSIMSVISFIAVIIGVALSIGLFFFLPSLLVDLLKMIPYVGTYLENEIIRSVVEGVTKIIIFICYIAATSLLKDIRRTYQYHGAEHKSIFCYEKGLELTVENVRMQKRFHPRCGTSFIFLVLIISILGTAILYSLVQFDTVWLRVLAKLLVLPILVGISYEFIMFAGKHDNIITKILSAPGLWMQRITTREPDDSIIEVAIVSLKTALIEEFPDFEVPFEEGYDINGKIEENTKTDGE